MPRSAAIATHRRTASITAAKITLGILDALYAPRVSPGFTGNPTAPTPSAGTNSIATTAFAQNAGFPSGTVMLFYQAAAPLGWTKQTTQNDKALRVVSGSTGGSAGARLVLVGDGADRDRQSHAGYVGIPAHNSSGSNTITGYPNGNNGYFFPMNPNSGWGVVQTQNVGGYNVAYPANNTTGVTYTNTIQGSNSITVSASGLGGGAHSHPLTLGLAYCDVIIASKN